MIDPNMENIRHENDPITNRDNFARMLKTLNGPPYNMGGAKLFVSPVNNPDWKEVSVNNNNVISLLDCE